MALRKLIKVCGCLAAEFPHRHQGDALVPVRSTDPAMDARIREAWLAGRERLKESGVSLVARGAA